jgi:hypothetical protein
MLLLSLLAGSGRALVLMRTTRWTESRDEREQKIHQKNRPKFSNQIILLVQQNLTFGEIVTILQLATT